MSEPVISHISDTARWVATYRAWESAEPDALFVDRLADRLAGERGRAIARVMPRQARNGWPLIARTKLIDDLLLRLVAEGCDRVLNLAAGLDTRPYRLELPASLEWIEADLPGLLDEKEQLLAGERPRCRLERVRVDLSIAQAREGLFERALAGSARALVLTEGLLVYLTESQVRTLAAELAARHAIHHWILDLCSPALLALMQAQMGRHLTHAPMQFAPADGLAWFEAIGWHVDAAHSLLRAAARFRRLPWLLRLFARLPEPDPRRLGKARWSAVVQLSR